MYKRRRVGNRSEIQENDPVDPVDNSRLFYFDIDLGLRVLRGNAFSRFYNSAAVD